MAFTDYLDEYLGDSKDIGTQKAYNCPFCENSTGYKLYVRDAGDDRDGLWDCKRCGRVGNPVSFVMQYNQVGFSDAKDTLSLYDYTLTPFMQDAKDRGFSTEEMLILYMAECEKPREQKSKQEKLVPPPLPVGFRQDWGHPDAWAFIDYLLNVRNFNQEDIFKHNVGFITRGHTTTATGKKVYLENHVIFLTHDNNGQYQYWNSRSIEKNPYVKTFNGPAKDGEYSKSTTVFNLNLARYKPEIVIVEGVPDALTIGDSGVATFGKQVTDKQINLIVGAITPEQRLYVMLDTDAKEQTEKLSKTLYKLHKNTYIVLNPSNEDANDMGRERTWEIIKNHSHVADDNGLIQLYLT